MKYQELKQLLEKAIPPDAWLVDFDDGNAVYEQGERYFEATFTIADGKVMLGPAQEVQKKVEYVKVQAALRLAAAQDKNAEDYGYKWRVRVVEFGTDVNGTHWAREPLVASLDKFEGARVFLLSEAQHALPHPFGKPPGEIVGWLANVSADDKGIEADLVILAAASKLRDVLVEAWEKGNPGLLGLSVDVRGKAKRKKVGGRTVQCLEEVSTVSVDVVYEPAAGGKFLRMAAARKAGQEEGTMLVKLLAALKASRPRAYESIKAKAEDGTVTEDEVLGLLAAVKPEDIEGFDDRVKAAVQEAVDGLKASAPSDDGGGVADSPDPVKETKLIACKMTLRDELHASELPAPVRDKLRKRFEGKVFEDEDLRAAITEEKEVLDKLTASGQIQGAGGVKVIETDAESRAKMLDDLFAGKFHSIKAAYIAITGDEQVTGQLQAARRLKAAVESTTWPEILGDAITRRMVAEYSAMGMDDWRKLVSIVPLSDFRTNHRTRMGGYGDLPTVAEKGPYAALTTPGDEEATYAATKRGGTEEVTLEAIKNDDVGAVRRIPRKLARAAKRTLYKFVFDFLRTNPVIYDGLTLFHATHGNLGSAALDAPSLTARRQAMLQQQEADSGEVLGIPPKYLIVPVELDKTAYDLIAGPRNSDFNPTSADFTRTLQLELIVVPSWTDDNDWLLAADPADIPGIEIGFLDGKEEPELFVQDMPNAGSMFTNDVLTYKIRHIYGGAVLDFKGFDKSVVV